MRAGVKSRCTNIVWAAPCAALLLVASTASADPITQVSGSTLGCFGSGCSSFQATVTNADFGVTFAGIDPFQTMLDATSISTVTIGTFTRDRSNVSSDESALPFTLQVLLTLPTGISGGQAGLFAASIFGTTPGGGGPLAVDIDNSWHRFTTSTGAFEFAILSDPAVNKNGSATLVGSLRNVAATTSPASVPEPASLMLVGLGLLGVVASSRRRR